MQGFSELIQLLRKWSEMLFLAHERGMDGHIGLGVIMHSTDGS